MEAVIVIDISPDRLPQYLGHAKPVDVNQLRFQAAELGLNHYIVCATGFFIHALADIQAFQKLFVLVACKLAFLI